MNFKLALFLSASAFYLGSCSKESETTSRPIPAAAAAEEGKRELSSCIMCGGLAQDPSKRLKDEKCIGGPVNISGVPYVTGVCMAFFKDAEGQDHSYACKQAEK